MTFPASSLNWFRDKLGFCLTVSDQLARRSSIWAEDIVHAGLLVPRNLFKTFFTVMVVTPSIAAVSLTERRSEKRKDFIFSNHTVPYSLTRW